MKRKIGWRRGGALLVLAAIWGAAASWTAFAAENSAKTEKTEAAKICVLVFDGGRPYDEPEFAEMLAALGDAEVLICALGHDKKAYKPPAFRRF